MADNQIMEVAEASETFPLDFHSSFVLFNQINSLEDCINLVEACAELQPIAERIYKRKFNKFSFDFRKPIDRTLRHAGATAKSLTLTLNRHNNTARDLRKIRNTCKQLRCLSVKGFQRKKFLYNPFANFGQGKLEVLTLSNCSLGSDIHFFDKFSSLKCLNLFGCNDISSIGIDRCFKNNAGITSFTCNDDLFPVPEMLLFLPNLERLSLMYESGQLTFNMLSQLPSLRHLTMMCDEDNINDVLAELGKSDRLEESELYDVDIDEETFSLIKSLQNLKLLSIISSSISLFPESKDSPFNIKTLGLEGFEIANGNIASLVKHHRHLKNLFLRDCEQLHDDSWVSDFDLMADLIIEELTDGDITHRSLNVTIKAEYEESPNIIKSVGRLRITNDVQNTSLFDTPYPGMYRGIPECDALPDGICDNFYFRCAS